MTDTSQLATERPEYGHLCVECEARYCLPGERATCTHKAICEDCWPNGCDVCEFSVAGDYDPFWEAS